jgi:hypothetical protein
MTKKRRFLWFGMVIGLVLAACFVLRPGVPKHNINLASFEKIKKGMTLAEVEAILGVAAGDYATEPTTSHCNGWWGPGDKEWVGDEGVISVWFDPQGKIMDKDFSPVSLRPGLNWFERLQMWLGLAEKTERISGPGPY